MRQLAITLLVGACVVCVIDSSLRVLAQNSSVPVNWQAELEKAKAGIEKNPDSAFWHNQAGVAYDALGDFKGAVRELKLASTLDPTNTISDYALYALYKRKGMLAQEREILLKALEKDSANPLGRFEFAHVLEREEHLQDALREYREARRLVAAVKGSEYVDSRGNPYDVDGVRDEVEKAVARVTKLINSEQRVR